MKPKLFLKTIRFYYLKNCSTCKRILKELEISNSLGLVDVKNKPINNTDLEFLKSLSGSYEALFSKKAQLYKKRNLKDQNLSEDDFKKLILEHYTFLKRPVLVVDKKIFIGNSPKVVEQAKNIING